MTDWLEVADSDDVASGGIVPLDLDDREVVLWRTVTGTLCASDARCPHQWSHLASQGAVDGEELVCLSHQWRFTVSGEGCRESMTGEREPMTSLPMVDVRERSGRIAIRHG